MTTRAHLRPARVLAVLALTAPLAGTLMLSTAAPALAGSGSIKQPAADTVVTSGTRVTVEAAVTLGKGETATLKTVGPGSSNPVTAKQNTCTGLTCPSSQTYTLSQSPTVSADAANGEFTITLTGPGISSTRHFYTNFAPTAAPSNLAAAPVGRTEVDLSWSYAGTEPDKAGFEIAETHDGSTRTLSVPASACSGSTCGYSIDYAEPAQATTASYTYAVTALRSSGGCGSCGSVTRSEASSSASAQLVGPPPPPSPTPSPTGGTTGGTTGTTTGGTTTGGTTTGGTTGATTGGTTGTGTTTSGTTGGTTGSHSNGTTGTTTTAKPIVIPTLPPIVASRRAFALGFNKFSPSLGIPKLPPLPATTFPVTAPGSDTYQPVLPYANEPGKTTSILSSPAAVFTDFDSSKFAQCLAVALVLLACAAHVRVFLSHTED